MHKAVLFKRVVLTEIFLLEAVFLIIIESYKYYLNLNVADFLSAAFLRQLFSNYKFFYPGNLFWFLLFFLSVSALTNLLLRVENVNDRPLKIVLFLSVLNLVILILSVLLPSNQAIDEFTGKVIQLNAKGTKIVLLSVMTGLKIFQVISLCVVSFSALKKIYLFRSVWLSITSAIVLFSSVFFLIYLFRDDKAQIVEQSLRFDSGVILGAAVWGGNRPSPVLRERINKGHELYKEGIIKTVLLTGGGAPGELTEAEVSRNELIKKGIDEKNIYVEKESSSTLGQITIINSNFYKKQNWNSVVLISDNFHLFRAKQICNFFGMNARVIASDTPISAEAGFSFSLKESFAVILFWLFGMG
jgi:uncharacterized SAM-binding protein YcdF (DUF218 family)